MDVFPADPHTLRSLLPACTTHLPSRLLDALRAALTALLTQLAYCAMSFARLGLDFRTLLPPLFEDAVRARVCGEFARAAEEFARTPETGLDCCQDTAEGLARWCGDDGWCASHATTSAGRIFAGCGARQCASRGS
ncbi:hypothetical protein BC826DRAFT_1026332 [Russula brevipes]|nr:hypothetical protein BC826DRAFT_1026332 [Russula brevipes]